MKDVEMMSACTEREEEEDEEEEEETERAPHERDAEQLEKLEWESVKVSVLVMVREMAPPSDDEEQESNVHDTISSSIPLPSNINAPPFSSLLHSLNEQSMNL